MADKVYAFKWHEEHGYYVVYRNGEIYLSHDEQDCDDVMQELVDNLNFAEHFNTPAKKSVAVVALIQKNNTEALALLDNYLNKK